jgi:hypothetical protein
MMRSLRQQKRQADSSSSDEESSSSDSEDEFKKDPVFQIGFLRIQYQKKDLIKETLARFGQSLLDLSISPTSIYYIGSTKFYTDDTPYEKF